MNETFFADGTLIVQRDGAIGRIIFNNPARRNAMSLAMWDGLAEGLALCAKDDAVRVVVLSGAGDHAFVSGADISEFNDMRKTPQGVRAYDTRYEAAENALYTFAKPTIAQIHGACVGGGMGIAIACDLRICSQDARMGIPAGKLGLGYGVQGVRYLVEVVGPSITSEVLFSADLFSAARAKDMGLVNRVVKRDALAQSVTDLAAQIAANAPMTMAAAKMAIKAVQRPMDGDDLDKITAFIRACSASQDYAEGLAAFAQKRAPRFQGR